MVKYKKISSYCKHESLILCISLDEITKMVLEIVVEGDKYARDIRTGEV